MKANVAAGTAAARRIAEHKPVRCAPISIPSQEDQATPMASEYTPPPLVGIDADAVRGALLRQEAWRPDPDTVEFVKWATTLVWLVIMLVGMFIILKNVSIIWRTFAQWN